MTDDLEGRIEALYAGPLEGFTPDRDALAKELRAQDRREDADRVKALRKPVAAAWALNAFARADPDGVTALENLGRRLRDAQRRAMSGGDAEPLRAATDERRALVSRLTARAVELAGSAVAGASVRDDVAGTLDAAAVDEGAAGALREGRLTRPMRPPVGFTDAPALTVLPGGARKGAPTEPAEGTDRERATAFRNARRELVAAGTRQRRAEDVLARARGRLEEAERRRSEAREAVREAEAAQRGVALEVKRLAAAVAKLERST
ncbi:MAG: hypothetical protein ACXWXP_10105 [Actinomycetota bacterium]